MDSGPKPHCRIAQNDWHISTFSIPHSGFYHYSWLPSILSSIVCGVRTYIRIAEHPSNASSYEIINTSLHVMTFKMKCINLFGIFTAFLAFAGSFSLARSTSLSISLSLQCERVERISFQIECFSMSSDGKSEGKNCEGLHNPSEKMNEHVKWTRMKIYRYSNAKWHTHFAPFRMTTLITSIKQSVVSWTAGHLLLSSNFERTTMSS